ncbi:hypothetical protein SEA_WIDOW_44 [Gordonia phage Widow]|nr:hypothetical protein SEA_PUPPERS_43 [Gordonia phage Puppers]UTN93336.1 hypothetical protein SEA_WIDOW_44 [Gordonia phage Widow]
MTFILEFHGGIQDGLVLSAPEFVPQVPLPADVVISNLKDYAAWEPKDGDALAVYVFQGPPRPYRESGYFAHHLYLDRQVTLHEIGQNSE